MSDLIARPELTRTELRRVADEFKSERDAAKRDTLRAIEDRNAALAALRQKEEQIAALTAEVADAWRITAHWRERCQGPYEADDAENPRAQQPKAE